LINVNAIGIGVNLSTAILTFGVYYFGYQKDKASPNMKEKYGRKALYLCVLLMFLSIGNALFFLVYPGRAPASRDETKNMLAISKLLGPGMDEIASEAREIFSGRLEYCEEKTLLEYQRGHSAFIDGNYQEAVRHYTEAINLRRDFAPAYRGRGCAWKILGNEEQASSDYEMAIKLNPNSAAYFNRGTLLLYKGYIDKAFEDFDTAIKKDPNEPGSYYRRGCIRLRRGETKQAFNDFEKAIQKNSKHGASYCGRGYIRLKGGRIGEQLDECDNVIKLHPWLVDENYGRGCAWLRKGDTERALAEYEVVFDLGPFRPY
jgi:tetratricopeptide (TPR) repeat protein